MKNAISEMKNIQEGIKIRLDKAEDGNSELEDKVEKIPSQSNSMKKGLKRIRIVSVSLRTT